MNDERAAREQLERQAGVVRLIMDSLADPLGDLLADLSALEDWARQLALFQLPEPLVDGSPFDALPVELTLPGESVEESTTDYQQPRWPRAPTLSKHPRPEERQAVPELARSSQVPPPVLPVGGQRKPVQKGSTALERSALPRQPSGAPAPASSATAGASLPGTPVQGAGGMPRDATPGLQDGRQSTSGREHPTVAQREGMQLLKQLAEELLPDRPGGAGSIRRRLARQPGSLQAPQPPERIPGSAHKSRTPVGRPGTDRAAGSSEAPGSGLVFEPGEAPSDEGHGMREQRNSASAAVVGAADFAPVDALEGFSNALGETHLHAGLDGGARSVGAKSLGAESVGAESVGAGSVGAGSGGVESVAGESPGPPDAESLAALINEVLVEQARRQGVDLS